MELKQRRTELCSRITTYIIKNAPVTMETIIKVAISKGFREEEVLTALDTVHKDKRITQTANSKGVVTYKRANAKKTPVDHLKWVREHYPPMDSTNDGSGIEADYSYLFLSPDEAKEYHATMKGINVWQQKRIKSKT